MAAEVNTRECVPPRQETQGLARSTKSPQRVRPAGDRGRRTEQVDKSVNWEEEDGMRPTVLQCKVKALKEKYMKERKSESRISECSGGEGDGVEDTLVNPQHRTYLTEELLDCSKHGRLSGAHQEAWRDDESWGTYNSNGPSITHYSDCKMADLSSHSTQHSSSVWPQDRLHSSSDSLLDGLQDNNDQDIISLTLAERVERNRKDLRNKLGKTSSPGGEVPHGCIVSQGQTGRDGSWLTGDGDGELGMSLSVTEECGELSVRHEQAKQLLQRARMKAKGASPLRASHCVLSHPHSQPNLHRGPTVSGALTDGGSLSDSSSSDYCSWHKGSRGSSPSHVRFQDESEREAEERYRERQQVPQTSPVTSTPPSKRQSNGTVSWTEQLPPTGHGQCGTCGSYIKGPGTSAAAIHGTNLRIVHLGSKITQDGPVNCPMGVKPSPHWILPSQPWRVHTELIRETHIGGDSTPDSSGDDDGNRNHSKKNCDWGMHKNGRNNTISTTPEQGVRSHTLNTLEREARVTRSHSEKSNDGKFGTTNHILEDRIKSNSNLLAPVVKTSLANPEVGTTAAGFCVDSVKTGLRIRRQDPGAKHTRKHKTTALEYDSELNLSNQEIGVGNIMLNVDTRDVNCRVDSTDCRTRVTPGSQGMPQMVSPVGISGHVPVPPSGKAPAMAPPRNRLTLRSGGSSHQLNHSPARDVMEPSHDKKGIQSNPVPNTRNFSPENVGTLDGHHHSTHGMKSKEHKSREQTQKLRKQAEDHKIREVKEKRNSMKIQMPKEQRDIDRHYTSSKQKDSDRHQSSRDQRENDSSPSTLLREQEKNEINYPKRDEKCSEKSGINGHPPCRSNADTGSGKCSRENSFNCQTTSPVILTKDRYLELAEDGFLQPVIKKGDIRSGMRKIFSSIGLTSRPRLERFQSSSLEQISTSDSHGRSTSADGDSESHDGSMNPGKIKKSPSLQSLKLMSPFHLPRKSSSVQNLMGKSDRSAVYITEDVNTTPRRALSVEDIGSPGKARAVGKVAQVYPDGTRLLELQRPENGTFGFKISSGNGRPDSGIYVQEMSDANTAKLYSGLLRVGDEVLEVNGTKVSTLGQAHLTDIMNREPVLSLRVLHQRRTMC